MNGGPIGTRRFAALHLKVGRAEVGKRALRTLWTYRQRAEVEGAVVTVVVHDDAEAFDTTPEEEHALLEAIAQADRGQVISWDRLREQLRRSA
jgi:hypothetical protein